MSDFEIQSKSIGWALCLDIRLFSRFSEILSSTFDEIRYEQAHTRLSAPADFLDKPLSSHF